MTITELKPGQALTWLYCPPGGYGYIVPVNAIVVRTTAKRVLITVQRKNGEMVDRWVNPDKLKVRG